MDTKTIISILKDSLEKVNSTSTETTFKHKAFNVFLSSPDEGVTILDGDELKVSLVQDLITVKKQNGYRLYFESSKVDVIKVYSDESNW